MKLRFFDFEVFPNWWCCVFGDMPDVPITEDNRLAITYDNDVLLENDTRIINDKIKDTFVVVRSDEPNARDKLLQLMREEGYANVGYNIKKYDLMIANAVYQGFTPREIKIISDLIIHPDWQFKTKEHMRLFSFSKRRIRDCVYLDTYDSSIGSLKDKEATLGLAVIETSVPFDKEDLTEEDKASIIYYCKHDVYSSMWWYLNTVHPFVVTKNILARKYNLEEKYAYIHTNAGLVSMALNVSRIDSPDAERIDITLPLKIDTYCRKWIPEAILNHVLTSKNSYTVKALDNEFTFADGGLHSVYDISSFARDRDDTPTLYVQSDDEYVLMNVDAGSYYPSMMIQFKTLSRAIPKPEEFDAILQERFAIKHKKNKTKEDNDTQLADKLILNTTYGASGSKWLNLYDPYQRTRTCRYGQLFLFALANKLYKTIPNLKIIQTNTDGILVYFKRVYFDKVKAEMNEWYEIGGITLEEDMVEKIWQRDVNNYYLVKEGNKIKVKGTWLNQTTVRPGYIMVSPQTAFICSKAVGNYILKGTDIVKTIISSTNLMDFCICSTKGPTFQEAVQQTANGEIPMYKCNRLIATKDTFYGKLYKVKIDDDGTRHYTQMANTPDHCLTLNDDLYKYSFDKIKPQLDYRYYLGRCMDLLDMTFVELSHDDIFKTKQFDYFNIQ